MLIRGEVAFHDYEGVAVDLGERERLVADLRMKNAMILRNHGTLAVGKNVGECFIRLYYLERACQAQIMALSAGDQLIGRRRDRLRSRPSRVQSACPWRPMSSPGPRSSGKPSGSIRASRPKDRMRRAANVGDYRELARAHLPHFLFEYLDGGSYDEITLAANVDDLRRVKLRQRVLRDVSELDLSTDLLGQKWSLPVGLSPVGLSGMYARRGEVQAARAAREAGVPFTLSSLSVCPVPRDRPQPSNAVLDAALHHQGSRLRSRPACPGSRSELQRPPLTVDLPVSGRPITAIIVRDCPAAPGFGGPLKHWLARAGPGMSAFADGRTASAT
jgi:hypothetical protein